MNESCLIKGNHGQNACHDYVRNHDSHSDSKQHSNIELQLGEVKAMRPSLPLHLKFYIQFTNYKHIIKYNKKSRQKVLNP